MEITLIDSKTHTLLKNLFEENPELTLQNNGYEYLNKSEFSNKTKDAFNEVSAILKNHVTGFSKFHNFRLSKNGEIEIRLDYNYNYDNEGYFIGVGYILLDELLNGF